MIKKLCFLIILVLGIPYSFAEEVNSFIKLKKNHSFKVKGLKILEGLNMLFIKVVPYRLSSHSLIY